MVPTKVSRSWAKKKKYENIVEHVGQTNGLSSLSEKMVIKRRNVAQEILTTEREYVKNLKILVQVNKTEQWVQIQSVT